MTPAAHSAAPAVRRLRIAVLNRLFKPTGGGAESYSIALVEQLAQRHEIHVFAQQIDNHVQGVIYHRVPSPCTRPRWINQLWFALATWWMTRRGFDVVHSHENTWHGQVQTVHVLPIKYSLFRGRVGLQRALRYLKVVISPRLLVYLGLEWGRYHVRLGVPCPRGVVGSEANLQTNEDKCIVVTAPGLYATMEQTYPACKKALAIVTPGVREVPCVASAEEQLAARLQLGLPTTGQCVLFIGNDYRKKGLPTLLQALLLLPKEAFLAVVGNPAHIAEFQSMARSLGLQDRVYFLGALRDVNPAYRGADCLAHPTLEDTFGMVILEAMAHGLPVVVSATAYCGISALLQHGENALVLYDPRNVGTLASAIAAVLSPLPLRSQLSASAQEFARSHLWSVQALAQEAIYLRVAGASAVR